MNKNILLLSTIMVFTQALPVISNAATQVYDLKTDWSDAANPNGPWSYRDSGGALLSNESLPWSYSCEGFEAIARTTEASVVPGVFELGDIYVLHGGCGITVRWAAPASGTVDLSGNTWGCAGILWKLQLNGNILSGAENSGGPRSAPYQFSSGSGGSAALQNIEVQAGDHVELFVWGYLVCFESDPRDGLNLTITLTTASIDPIASIESLADAVSEINLQNNIENSLDSKLDAALNALNDANINNDAAACNSLAAFISAVEAQRDNKITSAQADQLINSAQEIQAQLNCTN